MYYLISSTNRSGPAPLFPRLSSIGGRLHLTRWRCTGGRRGLTRGRCTGGRHGLTRGRCTRGRRRLIRRPRWTRGRRQLTWSLWAGGGVGGRRSPGEVGIGFLGVGGLGAEPGNMMYFFCHKMIWRLTSPSDASPSGIAKSSSRSSNPGTMSSTETRA
jgi:hypothetical protein